jgi:fucose 4-O-acetylase-like acetyltransferase
MRSLGVVSSEGSQRIAGLDLLRVALIALVVCHHVACAIGDVGSWYYILPPPEGRVTRLLFTIFVAVNQSFFMSLFFFVSGYFTAPAYDRKGTAAFLRDRGIRLGIPLLVYFFVLNPQVEFLGQLFSGQAPEGYLAWMREHWLTATGSGPLWFVLALLVFTGGYVLWCQARPADRAVHPAPLPGHATILGFVFTTGVAAFMVRLVYPVGETVFNLQLGYFPLYVCMYYVGISAYRKAWLDQLEAETTRPWFSAALALIVGMPVVLILGGALSDASVASGRGPDPFVGGLHWEAYAYAAWEPVLCVGISLKLLLVFRDRFRRETPFRARASKSAYTVYILHPFFVVVGTWLLAAAPVEPLLKFAILCPAAVLSCFAVSDLVRRMPLVRRVV